jgi:hypothetical protein
MPLKKRKPVVNPAPYMNKELRQAIYKKRMYHYNSFNIDCTAALLSNVKYSLTFPPFIFTFVAKSIFLLSDIMATTDFLLKQSSKNKWWES